MLVQIAEYTLIVLSFIIAILTILKIIEPLLSSLLLSFLNMALSIVYSYRRRSSFKKLRKMRFWARQTRPQA